MFKAMKNTSQRSKIGRVALAAAIGSLITVGCANEQLFEPAGTVPRTPTVESTIDLSRTGPSTSPETWNGARGPSVWWNIESFE